MATAEVKPDVQETPPQTTEAVGAAPAATPDAAAQEALKKAEAAQNARVTLAAMSAPKPTVDLGLPAEQPVVGMGETTPPTIPSTPEEAKEPEFLDSVLKYYDEAVARGKGPVGATFDAILYALTTGSTKLWDWVSGLFNGKKKDEESPEPSAATPAEAAETSKDKPFDEDFNALCKQFNITEKDPKKRYFLVTVELGKEVEEKYGIPYQVVVGQACLESGFGTSDLVQRAFNTFGIQALGNYSGKKSGAYRAYESLSDCFTGYGVMLSTSSIYKAAFAHKDDPKQFLEAIKAAGYAEDPDYVSKVISAAAVYDLSFANANS